MDLLTPEEKFDQAVWWVLGEIKKESIATQKIEDIYFDPSLSNELNISKADQIRALEFLEKKLVLEIKKRKLPFNMPPLGADLYNLEPIGFLINIQQPEFDSLYKEYEEKQKKIIALAWSRSGQEKNLEDLINSTKKEKEGLERDPYIEEIKRTFDEITRKADEKEKLKKEIIEEMKSIAGKNNEKNQENNKTPFCITESNWGYLKFSKHGEKIKIGKPNTRHFRFLECLLDPFGTPRTLESVYERIKLSKDQKDSDLTGFDRIIKKNKQLIIIQNTIKELQKGNKLKKKIVFEFDGAKNKIWAKKIE